MFRSFALATLVGVAVLASAGDANACFGLLNGMGGCGCDSCCEPCCDAGPRCCLLGGLRGIFHRHNCCCETSCCEEASCGCEEPSCEAAEPSCEADCGCEADCCCEPCCRPRCCLLGGLRGLFHRHNNCCCEASCDCGCGN